MSSNHCFEFEYHAEFYKTHKQPLHKAWKGEQKNLACVVYIFLVQARDFNRNFLFSLFQNVRIRLKRFSSNGFIWYFAWRSEKFKVKKLNCLINRNTLGCFIEENIFKSKIRPSLLPSCVRHFALRKEAHFLYHYLKEKKKVPGQIK